MVLEVVRDVLLFTVGVALVLVALASAVRTVVLPRAARAHLTTFVARSSRRLFDLFAKRTETYEQADRIMGFYGPVTVLLFPVAWLTLVLIGYTCMFWALGVQPLREAATLSGSSLFTLGFAVPRDLPGTWLTFTEAGLGIGLLALMITYLPSMYSTFSRREALVTWLEVRAGSPPSAEELVLRFHRIGWLDKFENLWEPFETWFVEVAETHTATPALVHFRSPQPEHSWVTAAGTVLDTAAFVTSSLDRPWDSRGPVLLRTGFIALRRIADFFRLPYEPDPQPDDPISVLREEYDAMYDRLAAEGVPLKADREQAWRDFAGWRVNYDTVLLSLAGLVMAPYALWSSDRSPVPGREAEARKRSPLRRDRTN